MRRGIRGKRDSAASRPENWGVSNVEHGFTREKKRTDTWGGAEAH